MGFLGEVLTEAASPFKGNNLLISADMLFHRYQVVAFAVFFYQWSDFSDLVIRLGGVSGKVNKSFQVFIRFKVIVSATCGIRKSADQ